VPYLECAKGGPRRFGEGGQKSPSGVQVQVPPVGVWAKGLSGQSPQKLTLFVDECLNFDVLESGRKNSKTAKIPS